VHDKTVAEITRHLILPNPPSTRELVVISTRPSRKQSSCRKSHTLKIIISPKHRSWIHTSRYIQNSRFMNSELLIKFREIVEKYRYSLFPRNELPMLKELFFFKGRIILYFLIAWWFVGTWGDGRGQCECESTLFIHEIEDVQRREESKADCWVNVAAWN